MIRFFREGYRLIKNKVIWSLLGDELERVKADAQNRHKDHIALRETSTIITSSLDLGDILYKIAEQLCHVADATSVYIENLDFEQKKAEVVAEFISDQASEAERVSDLGTVYEVTDTRYLLAMEAGQPWVDTVDDPVLPEHDRAHLLEYGAKSVMYIPMKVGSQIVGTAEVWESRRIREFTKNEIMLCQSFAQNAAIAMDIAERAVTEASLRQSEERYSLAAQGANDGLWDWDLDNNQIYYSSRWKDMLGYSENKINGDPQDWLQLIHPEDLEEFQLTLSTHLNGQSDHFKHEYRIKHHDGTYRWMLIRGLAVRGANEIAYRIAGSQTDITLRKRAEEQLIYDAFHDSLSGLPNRALLLDRLERVIEHAKRRPDYIFAVLFLDIDRFKNINDRSGHIVGDRLLIAISERLLSATRTTDTVARLGGDEFVILLEDIENKEEATRVADRILEKLNQPFKLDGHTVYASCSIGIILDDDTYTDNDELLRDADIAMYRAKSDGRGRYITFDPTMRKDLMDRIWLENDLRHALAAKEFCLHYQPVFSLNSGKPVGFEALLRWQHPTEGLIPPGRFISLAEETRMIIPIGYWVLQEACRQLKEWEARFQSNPPLSLSVNVSSIQLTQQEFVEQVDLIISEAGLNPSNLVFEITESMIIGDNQVTDTVILQLKELGVRLHLDDFGTGYSALSYLQQYPFDILKIDRSFIGNINKNADNIEIIKTILNMARDLDMGVIAEGIETEQHYDLLKDLNCGFGQGFYLAKPMDHKAIESMLTSCLFVPNMTRLSQIVDQSEGN